MASIKNLKKDINYVLGDVIDYALDVSILKNAPGVHKVNIGNTSMLTNENDNFTTITL